MNTWSNMSPILWFNLVKQKVEIDSNISVLSFLHAWGSCSSFCELCINLLLHSRHCERGLGSHPIYRGGQFDYWGSVNYCEWKRKLQRFAIGKRRRGHKRYVFRSDSLRLWKKSLMAASSLSLALEWSQNRWESKGRDPLGAIMNNLKENDEGKTKERVPVI